MGLKPLPIRRSHIWRTVGGAVETTGHRRQSGARIDGGAGSMPQRKRIFFKALLPLSLLSMAAAFFGRRPDEWEYETAEDVVEPIAPAAEMPAAPRHPKRHFALAAAFTTLFFAGAAFTAGAGDQMVRLAEEDEAALEAADLSSSPAAEAEPAPEPAAQEASPEAPAEPAQAETAPAEAAPVDAGPSEAPATEPAPAAEAAPSAEVAP